MNTSYFHPDFYLGRKSRSRVESAYFEAIRALGQMKVDAAVNDANGITFDTTKVHVRSVYKKLRGPVKRLFDHMLLKDDQSDRLCSELAERFKRSPHATIYHVNKDFVDHLISTPMTMNPEWFPDVDRPSYISIEEGALLGHGNESIVGAYTRAYMKKSKEDGDILILRACLLTRSKPGKYFCQKCQVEHSDDMTFWIDLSFQMAFKPELDVDAHINEGLKEQEECIREECEKAGDTPEQLADALKVFHDSVSDFRKATGLVAKLTLHLKSPDAYLLSLPMQITQSSNERKEQIEAGFPLNNSAYSVVLVNWNHGDFINQPKGDSSEDSISGHAER